MLLRIDSEHIFKVALEQSGSLSGIALINLIAEDFRRIPAVKSCLSDGIQPALDRNISFTRPYIAQDILYRSTDTVKSDAVADMDNFNQIFVQPCDKFRRLSGCLHMPEIDDDSNIALSRRLDHLKRL